MMNTQEFIDKWTDRPGEQAVMARDIEAMVAALQAENERLRAALKPFAKVAESHSFPPSVPPEKCILWNKTSSIQGTLIEITLADCIEARRVREE